MTKRPFRWRFVVGAVMLGAAVVIPLWMLHLERCHQKCAEVLSRGEALAGEGQWLSALRLLDDTDASCNCMQFTEGDEPPEHSSARAWLRSLEDREGRAALDALKPQGPVLRMLLRDRGAGPR